MRESLSYWIAKVAPFRQGTTLLPRLTERPDPDHPAVRLVVPAPATDAMPTELLALGALVLVMGRYNGGEPLLVACPSMAPPDGLIFLALTSDDSQTAAAFLASVGAEVEESRRHQPCRLETLETLAPRLGLDADDTRGLLRLGFACGTGASAAFIRTVAELFLQLEPGGDEWFIEIGCGIAGGSSRMARQLTGQVARAMAWLSASGHIPLGEFDLLSDSERRQVACGFNQTGVEIGAGQTLHGLVEARAALTPDATAVIDRDLSLSYRSLEQQANRLADLLRQDFGVILGDRVGVMMERSNDLVVALYGAMKAGAAYVPIDPRHPWDTIRDMIEQAGIGVLIVDSDTIAAAAGFAGRLVVIDVELRTLPRRSPAGAKAGRSPEDRQAGPADLAYVIYTSGSTGRPNGVAIEHRAIVNTILWRNHFYGLGPDDVTLQVPSFAFDSSVVDIFCALTAGGTLVIPDAQLRLDAQRLMALCAARRVTGCIVTPSYYHLLVSELGDSVPSLRWITLAGEAATPQIVAAHLARLPGVSLVNEYGPTENAVCSTACRLESVEPTVSIGRPIWNVAVFILDVQRRLSPIGASGEIFLGGAGLARGYLNQDRLTAERFVASPIAEFQGRLYRTGDRACWRSDGSIEFLGRLDSQVKIRGVRIELDDVELALRRHPGLANAAVVCKDDPGGAKYLAAYAEAEESLTAGELREHLRRQLPHYMVPDVVAMLPRLPLNLNGKVDRAALRRLDDFTGAIPLGPPDPVSPLEAALLLLWADVLKRSHIARDDNFFSIGGNSLRVMELTTRIRGELAIDVALLDIYTSPTVTGLAGRLAEMREERHDANR